MISFSSSVGLRNVTCSSLTRFAEIFQSKEFGETFPISFLNVKEFLKWFVDADTASPQQVTVVLGTKTESRSAHKSATVFADADGPFPPKRELSRSANF